VHTFPLLAAQMKLFARVRVYIPAMKKIALLLALTLAPRAFADDAATLVARVQKYYDATKSLRAKFDQELTSPTTGTKKATGEVLLKKPGKMRWDYATPEKKLMVSDGATLWVYEPDDEQAVKQDLKGSTLPAQVSFLVGEGKLDKEFDASLTKLDNLPAGTVALKMVPKTGTAAYRYLVFVVDEKTGQVKQTLIYDQQGGTNKLSFSDVQQNKSIDDGKFKFSPPTGTQIIKP
jgi:outer membrane lipoprotein carrier protein